MCDATAAELLICLCCPPSGLWCRGGQAPTGRHGPSGRVGFRGWNLLTRQMRLWQLLASSACCVGKGLRVLEALLRVKCRSQTAFAILQE